MVQYPSQQYYFSVMPAGNKQFYVESKCLSQGQNLASRYMVDLNGCKIGNSGKYVKKISLSFQNFGVSEIKSQTYPWHAWH